MKDVNETELKLGDRVAVTKGGEVQELVLGEIVKFTPKSCRVKLDKSLRPWRVDEESLVLRQSHQVIMISRHPDRETELLTMIDTSL